MAIDDLFKVRDFAEDFITLLEKFGYCDGWSAREVMDHARGIEGMFLIKGKKQRRGLKLILANLNRIIEQTDEYVEAARLKDFLMKWIKEELK